MSEQRLKAGTKLGEQALSDIFSCSRDQVRRALTALSAHKIVELKPNRGAFITTPLPQEARNVFQARRAIEKTVTRNVIGLISKRDLARLRRHVDKERAAREADNRREAIRLSGQFHLVLAEIGENDVLAGFLNELVLRSSLIIGLYATSVASMCEDDEHLELVNAIGDRDEARALALIDGHLRHLESGLSFSKEHEAQDLSAILSNARARKPLLQGR